MIRYVARDTQMHDRAIEAAVTSMLRQVAETVILPRFRSLAGHEIGEKAPGEVVTIADREAEFQLSAGLAALLPEARIVGEEACDAQLEMLEGLDQGVVWLIDPLDGTRNFANGVEHFAVMVALIADGITQAGWIYDPLGRRMHSAQRGKGAFVDGVLVKSRASSKPGLIGALPSYYADEDGREQLKDLQSKVGTVLPGLMCAGADYPRCVDGTQDFAMFWRSLPWDHAPGALFLEEAGGKVGWLDGTSYAVGDTRPGLLAAASPDIWDRAVLLANGHEPTRANE